MVSVLLRHCSVLVRHFPKTRLYQPIQHLSPSSLRLLSSGNLQSSDPPKVTETEKGTIHQLPQKKSNLAPNKTPISWQTLGIAAIVFGIMLQVLWYLKKIRKEEMDKKRTLTIGQAAIGGDFELVDSSKKLVSNKDFLGKWILIYFGFTHCPDICPEELEKMALVVDSIDKQAKDVSLQPLFISVDPERDTPELIAKYTAEFHPRLRGLTGTIDQIKDICKKYRIYYSAGPKEDGDYIVDHTIIMYLLNPKGEFQQYYGRNKSAQEIARDILSRMAVYQE